MDIVNRDNPMTDDTNVRPITEQEKDDIKAFIDANPTMAETFPRTLPCGKSLEGLDLYRKARNTPPRMPQASLAPTLTFGWGWIARKAEPSLGTD